MAKKNNQELMQLDLYELLEVSINSNEAEIKKAYRKKALTCHPDKNPDNPDAAAEFDRLKKILEILLDPGARSAYDKVVRARKAASIRAKEQNALSQKFRAQLEEKERAAASQPNLSEEERFRRELKRLEEEGERLIQEELRRVNTQVEEELRKASITVHHTHLPVHIVQINPSMLYQTQSTSTPQTYSTLYSNHQSSHTVPQQAAAAATAATAATASQYTSNLHAAQVAAAAAAATVLPSNLSRPYSTTSHLYQPTTYAATNSSHSASARTIPAANSAYPVNGGISFSLQNPIYSAMYPSQILHNLTCLNLNAGHNVNASQQVMMNSTDQRSANSQSMSHNTSRTALNTNYYSVGNSSESTTNDSSTPRVFVHGATHQLPQAGAHLATRTHQLPNTQHIASGVTGLLSRPTQIPHAGTQITRTASQFPQPAAQLPRTATQHSQTATPLSQTATRHPHTTTQLHTTQLPYTATQLPLTSTQLSHLAAANQFSSTGTIEPSTTYATSNLASPSTSFTQVQLSSTNTTSIVHPNSSYTTNTNNTSGGTVSYPYYYVQNSAPSTTVLGGTNYIAVNNFPNTISLQALPLTQPYVNNSIATNIIRF